MSASQFALLGLDPRAKVSETEINTAYRRLALELHPDKNIGQEGATAKFQALNTAYKAVLASLKLDIPT